MLRCLGNGQHLRSKYGNGYQIEVSFVNPTDEEISNKADEMLAALGRNLCSLHFMEILLLISNQ